MLIKKLLNAANGISNFSIKLHVSNMAQMTLNYSSIEDISITLYSHSDNVYNSFSFNLKIEVENNLVVSCWVVAAAVDEYYKFSL